MMNSETKIYGLVTLKLPAETPPSSRKRRISDSDEEQYEFVAAVILDPEEPKTLDQAWFSDSKERSGLRAAVKKACRLERIGKLYP
jgi:hypothetical protein